MSSAGRLLTVAEYRALWVGVLRSECGAVQGNGFGIREGATARECQGWRGLAVLAMLGELGLRVGEAVQVTWNLLGPVRRGSPVLELPGDICKGGRGGVVVVTPAARWALAVWWLRLVGRTEDAPGKGDPVVWDGRTLLGVRGVQKLVGRWGRRYIGRHVSPHDLRRTFGDRVRRVADVRIAQLMLRHARLSSTERYLGGDLTERIEAARKLAADVFELGVPDLATAEWAPVAAVPLLRVAAP